MRGSFQGIEVVKRGFSPRIVSAYVLGSGGRTLVSGPELASRLGLYSAWAYFSTREGQSVKAEPDRSGWSALASPAPAAAPGPSSATQGGVPPATAGRSRAGALARQRASTGTRRPASRRLAASTSAPS